MRICSICSNPVVTPVYRMGGPNPHRWVHLDPALDEDHDAVRAPLAITPTEEAEKKEEVMLENLASEDLPKELDDES